MLNELRDKALDIATKHGFTDATPGEDIALMHSELSEALEDIRSGHDINLIWYINKSGLAYAHQIFEESREPMLKPCGVPTELADVMIRIFHFCGKHNIDIQRAVKEKMDYNETRPFKHGGKKL